MGYARLLISFVVMGIYIGFGLQNVCEVSRDLGKLSGMMQGSRSPISESTVVIKLLRLLVMCSVNQFNGPNV